MILLILIVILAIIFDYVNGFHDSANAIATVVGTRTLTPRQAVIMAGVLNIIGALLSTKVAKTLGEKIASPSDVTVLVILSALIGAIVWNLITWYFGLPSSSSHALIGGLIGSVIFSKGFSFVHWKAVIDKVFTPAVISPILGVLIGYFIMLSIYWIFRKFNPDKLHHIFKKIQIFSAGVMALAHGTNDAQKTMGVITMALVSFGILKTFYVPLWVKLACAIAMGLGTAAGGWRIIKTMGMKMVKLKSPEGFAAETSSTIVILGASHFGMPISTTHVITSTIMGVGASKRLNALKFHIVGQILIAWLLTVPLSALIAGLAYKFLSFVF